MRKQTAVHLVTQVRERDALLQAGLTEGSDFTAIDSELIARPFWRMRRILGVGRGKGWTTVMALNALPYYYFEHLLWKLFRKQLTSGQWDIVHRLTPLSPALPSLIARRCKSIGVPFVVGPMNGGLPWPKQFRQEQKREREWLSTFRRFMRLLPRWRSTFQDAACVISGSQHIAHELAPLAGAKHVCMARNGVDISEFAYTERPGAKDRSRPLHLIFVGRLVPLKACDMLLEAMAPLMRAGRVRLTLVGDGPERPALESLCKSLDIEDSVVFTGMTNHASVIRLLGESDVFVFPSIREFGGAVVLEAMACGLPVIVMDYGGPAELTSFECGITIQLGTRKQIVADLCSHVEHLERDRALVRRMGKNGRRRAEELFDWNVKAQQLCEVYEWVLSERPEQLEFTADRPAPRTAEPATA